MSKKNGREVAEQKAKAGAPTKFKEEFCGKLIDHMANGLSFESFAGIASVCFDTLYEWEKVYPQFSEAKRNGRAKLLLWDEELLSRGAQGKQRGYNINAHKWKMANIHKWKDRVETTERKPGQLSDEDLIKETAGLLTKLQKKES